MPTQALDKQAFVSVLLEKGILIDVECLSTINDSAVFALVEAYAVSNPDAFIDQAVISSLMEKTHNRHHNMVGVELDEEFNSDRDSKTPPESISKNENIIEQNKKQWQENKIILLSHFSTPEPFSIASFTSYFSSRYKALSSILRYHNQLSSTISISRAKARSGQVSIIAMIMSKKSTKFGNYVLEVEDLTGNLRVIIKKEKNELYVLASNLVDDCVVGFIGQISGQVLFANEIILPGVPASKELKRAHKESYAVFLSDLHVGSKNFLADSFEDFLSWVNGKSGSEEEINISKNISHIFIGGDLVDGVGVYPNQEPDLEIADIRKQYDVCASYLSRIPKHIPIIIIPGNHDYVRIAEPQPKLDYAFASSLALIPNLVSLPNPSYFIFGKTDNFEGFEILLYHGFSFDYYVANVGSIRAHGGYDRADLIMKFLLQLRHLAPSYSSTQIIPFAGSDPLAIHRIPDFFVTGHIHKFSVSNYRAVTMISGSCWQSTTPFQEKMGHKPEPGRVPVVNLMDRSVRVLRF